MTDAARNPIFASVAADLRLVPGGHYSLADVQPYATTTRRRDARGRFAKKEQAR